MINPESPKPVIVPIAIPLEQSLQSYTFPLTSSTFDNLLDSLMDELSGIVDRLDLALDSGRSHQTEIDLDRAYEIIGKVHRD